MLTCHGTKNKRIKPVMAIQREAGVILLGPPLEAAMVYRVERALRESEERLRLAFAGAQNAR